MRKHIFIEILENGTKKDCKNSRMRSKIISRFKKIKIEKEKELKKEKEKR